MGSWPAAAQEITYTTEGRERTETAPHRDKLMALPEDVDRKGFGAAGHSRDVGNLGKEHV